MASELSDLEQALCQRMNSASVHLIDGTPWCVLCYKELPFKAQLISHTFGKHHFLDSFSIYAVLVEKYFSPGILLQDDTISCMLCAENISSRFDWRFHQHLDGYSHLEKVQVQLENTIFDSFYDELFDLSQYTDSFVAKVSRAGILWRSGDEMVCIPCGHILRGWDEFKSHVNGLLHMRYVKHQLEKLADHAGLVLGITIDDGSYWCNLCEVDLGLLDLPDTLEKVLYHVRANAHHADREREQINGGLYTYYGTNYDSGDDYYNNSDDYLKCIRKLFVL